MALASSSSAAPAPANPGPQGGRGGSGGPSQQVIAKSLALCMMQVRELRALAFVSLRLRTNSPEVEAMRSKLKEYGASCQAAGKGHALGPPAIHIFGTLARSLAARPLDALPQVALQALAELPTRYEAMGLEDSCLLVGHCKVVRMYDEDHQRLELHLSDPTAMRLVVGSLVSLGGRRLLGAAPPGGLERQVKRAGYARSRCGAALLVGRDVVGDEIVLSFSEYRASHLGARLPAADGGGGGSGLPGAAVRVLLLQVPALAPRPPLRLRAPRPILHLHLRAVLSLLGRRLLP